MELIKSTLSYSNNPELCHPYAWMDSWNPCSSLHDQAIWMSRIELPPAMKFREKHKRCYDKIKLVNLCHMFCIRNELMYELLCIYAIWPSINLLTRKTSLLASQPGGWGQQPNASLYWEGGLHTHTYTCICSTHAHAQAY